MSDITDLIKPITESEYWAQLQTAYDGAKVAWRSWSTRNPFLVVSRFSTLAAEALRESVLQMARGMFLQFATGTALTLFAASCYQLERQPATFARGRVVIRLSLNVSPLPVIAGQVRIGTPGPVTQKSKVFTCITGTTLQPGENTVVDFEAEGTGDGYNLPVSSPVDLKTSLVGATASIEASGEPTTIGSGNASLVVYSAQNGILLEILNPAMANQALTKTIDTINKKVIVSLATNGASALTSTASEVRKLLANEIPFGGGPYILYCALGGDGTGIVQPSTPVTLDWTGTWLSTYGQNEQDDDGLKEDCANRWDTLGGGAGDGAPASDAATDSALAFYAKQPPAGRKRSPVEQVRVYSNTNDMGVLDGAATLVVIAGAAGALPTADVTAVAANFENPQKYSYGTTLYVKSAVNFTVAIAGTVNVSRASGRTLAEVQTAVITAFATEKSIKKIGITLQPSKLDAILIDADRAAIDSFVRTAPLAPVALAYNQVAVIDLSGLVFQYVP